MTKRVTTRAIQKIPIAEIEIANPRSRDPTVFQGVVENINALGLKRPITVSRMGAGKQGKKYRLVCGQGRLEAYDKLGETHIPAVIRKISQTDAYLMSLVENIARHKPTGLEAANDLRLLRERGYKLSEISQMTDLSTKYLRDILFLFEHGEERLIDCVQAGRLPISIAVEISRIAKTGDQKDLQLLYEQNQLDEKALKTIKRIALGRMQYGRRTGSRGKSADTRKSLKSLLKAYRQETDRQQHLVERFEEVQVHSVSVLTKLKEALKDREFRTILREEGLDDVPAAIKGDLLVKRRQANK